MMNFRSVSELSHRVMSSLHRIPGDVDVVVGIARSGMLPATLIALALNRPLAEMRQFASGQILGAGRTRRTKQLDRSFADFRHALIVDDSVDTGKSMQEARAMLADLAGKIKLTYCAVYGVADRIDGVDLILETLPHPRVFEWNVMHHGILAESYVDIDGVLCLDPTNEQNDDGREYLNFLEHATPLVLPSQRIGALVTSRLEKYRAETERWLARHNIQYDRLIMLDLPSAEERRRLGAHGTHKAKHYADSNARLFIESEHRQAQQIAELSGKPVLSIEGPVMCDPDRSSLVFVRQELRRKGPANLAARAVRKAIRMVRS